jgi:hypothetical protein
VTRPFDGGALIELMAVVPIREACRMNIVS